MIYEVLVASAYFSSDAACYLKRQVKKKLEEGYQLCGGVSVCFNTSAREFVFSQAVYKSDG